MKFLILFLISFNLYANYIPESQVENCDSKTVWMKRSKCGANCIKLDKSYNCNYSELEDEMIDDAENPIWATRSMVEACSGQSDCEQKLADKVCVDERRAFTNAEFTETWCNKITGFAQKLSGRKIIVENSTKKSSYESDKAAKAAQEAALDSQFKDMDFGKELYAKVMLLNKSKGLSKAQRKQLRKDLKDIRDDLADGDICSAREDISALVADGTLIREEDKTAVLALIDANKTCP